MLHYRPGIGNEIGVGDFEVPNTVAGFEHLANLVAMLFLHTHQGSRFDLGRRF